MFFSIPQAPVQVFGIEGRYAHAIFSAASRSKSLEKTETELKDFKVCVRVNQPNFLKYETLSIG